MKHKQTNARILDLVEVLHTLGDIDQQVRTGGVRSKAPDLPGVGDIPTELIGENASTGLEIVTRADLAGLDGLGELFVERHRLDVQTIVLVLRLGEGNNRGLGLDSLTVRNNGVRDLQGNTGVILLEILQANFLHQEIRSQSQLAGEKETNQVELSGTGDNVLSSLGDPCLHTGIRLGETLETFNELGEIGGVLDLDSDLDDRRDREPHDTHVVGSLAGRQGTRFEQELIDTDETDDVTSRAILNGLDSTSHHQHGPLDALDEEILLLSGQVVGALDTNLGS